MGHKKSRHEPVMPGDRVVFTGTGSIIVRRGRGHVKLFVFDGKRQARMILPTEQADQLILALESILYPQLHRFTGE